MPTLRDIKRRIRAVNNTRQITKAMKMVAAAKLRKSQARMFELRPYADKMGDVLRGLAKVSDSGLHPLLTVRPRKTVEVVVITSDRGLCGAFNSNILRAGSHHISNLRREGFNVTISAIGKKAVDYFKRRQTPMRRTWTGLSGRVTYPGAQEIAGDIIENYVGEAIDEVVLIYNEFKSVVSQKVSVVRLLPLSALEAEEGVAAMTDVVLYEPSQKEIFDRLLPKNVEIQLFRALLESQASEEAARMTAMENATKNANDMIDRLTLQYNKARQAAITKELMDIVGGVEAMK
ncbi:MAG: ATP synthase F1 subunit gamma [Thermodesulfovibrionales bacterium]